MIQQPLKPRHHFPPATDLVKLVSAKDSSDFKEQTTDDV